MISLAVFLFALISLATGQTKVVVQSTTITDQSIGLTWNAISGATGYRVSMYCWPEKTIAQVNEKSLCKQFNVADNFYNATCLTQNKYYEFVVAAIDNNGEIAGSKSKEYRVATANGAVVNNVLPSSAPRELTMPFSDMALNMEYKGLAMTDPNYYYWCITPIEGDDGKIHVFTCRWAVPNWYTWDKYMRGEWTTPQGDMGGWKNICEIAHFVGDTPTGPWTYVDTPISNDVLHSKGITGQVAPHNIRVKKIDGVYCLLYIVQHGNWVWNATYEEFATTLLSGQSQQKQALATATSLNGPWTFQGDNGDGIVVYPEPPSSGHWTSGSALGTDNGDIIKIDGKYRVYFKAGGGQDGSMKYGYAESDQLTKGYVKMNAPSTDNIDYIEDANVFEWNGKIYLMTTDNFGGNSTILKPGDRDHNRYEVGILWESQDRGKTFKRADAKIAYGLLSDYMAVPPLEFDRSKIDPELPTSTQGYGYSPKFERPAVLMQGGKPTYFYAAVPLSLTGYNATQSVVMKINDVPYDPHFPATGDDCSIEDCTLIPYDPVELGWTATACGYLSAQTNIEELIFDYTNICDTAYSFGPAVPANWLRVDMKTPTQFNQIVLVQDPAGFPPAFIVETSNTNNGSDWKAVDELLITQNTVNGVLNMVIDLPAAPVARYFRIKLTADRGGIYWTVCGLYVGKKDCNCTPIPTTATITADKEILLQGETANITLASSLNNLAYTLYLNGAAVPSSVKAGNGSNLIWTVNKQGKYIIKAVGNGAPYCSGAVTMDKSINITVMGTVGNCTPVQYNPGALDWTARALGYHGQADATGALTGSKWEGGPGPNYSGDAKGMWFRVNMVNPTPINQIILYNVENPSHYPHFFDVQISETGNDNNDSDWITIISCTRTGSRDSVTVNFPTVTTQFFRILITENQGGEYWTVSKIEVNGEECDDPVNAFTFNSNCEQIATGYYNILGRKLSGEPTSGIYIIKYTDGTTKKLVK